MLQNFIFYFINFC